MPVFTYLARDRGGQQRTDAIESPTRESAILALREQGLLPLKIEELKKDGGPVRSFSLNPLAYRAFSPADIEHEFHQIAVMLRSGISLLDALNLTQKHCRPGARPTWERLAKRIQQGSSFKDALSEHKAFSEFTIQLIHVGEQTGHLSTVLDEAAKEVKSSLKLKKQIVTALRYPAFTLLFAIGLVIFMLTSIIPEIKKLLQIMGKPMPPVTQALIDTSDWMLANGLTIVVLAIASIVTFIVLYHLPTSRWLIDKWALKLPLFGYVLRLIGTVLFLRAMGLLLRSGVVMVDALKTMENFIVINTWPAHSLFPQPVLKARPWPNHWKPIRLNALLRQRTPIGKTPAPQKIFLKAQNPKGVGGPSHLTGGGPPKHFPGGPRFFPPFLGAFFPRGEPFEKKLKRGRGGCFFPGGARRSPLVSP